MEFSKSRKYRIPSMKGSLGRTFQTGAPVGMYANKEKPCGSDIPDRYPCRHHKDREQNRTLDGCRMWTVGLTTHLDVIGQVGMYANKEKPCGSDIPDRCFGWYVRETDIAMNI